MSQAKWWKHCGDIVRQFSSVLLLLLDRVVVAKPQASTGYNYLMTIDCSEKSDVSNMLSWCWFVWLGIRNLNSRVDVFWVFWTMGKGTKQISASESITHSFRIPRHSRFLMTRRSAISCKTILNPFVLWCFGTSWKFDHRWRFKRFQVSLV